MIHNNLLNGEHLKEIIIKFQKAGIKKNNNNKHYEGIVRCGARTKK